MYSSALFIKSVITVSSWAILSKAKAVFINSSRTFYYGTPVNVSITFPLWIKNTAGIYLTFNPSATCGKLSIFNLINLNFPSWLTVYSSNIGVSFLHGAHQL